MRGCGRTTCSHLLSPASRPRFWRVALQCEPSCQILLRTFLGLKSLRYDDHRPLRAKMPQQCSHKRLGRGADACARQHSPPLQTPGQGLHSESFRDSSEQFACRCDCQILRQAGARSQPRSSASSGGKKSYKCWDILVLKAARPKRSLTPPDPEELTWAVPATTTAPAPSESPGFPQGTGLWWYQEDSSQPQNPCGGSGCVSLFLPSWTPRTAPALLRYLKGVTLSPS